VRQRGRPQPEAGQPGGLPVLQQVSQAGGGAGVDAGVAVVLGPGQLVQALLARDGGGLGLVEEHHQVTEDVHGLPLAAGPGLPGPDLGHDLRGVGRVARGDEPDVGRARDQLVRHAGVAERGHDRLALRRPRGDRRPLHRKPAALEVDIVQLVPVDEPAGGHVADFRVVLPAVPEPAQHLHVVGGLVEALGDQPLHGRITELVRAQRRDLRRPKWAAASARARSAPGPRPAGAHVVQRGDGLGQVERLRVGGDRGRHEPDVPGDRRGPGRDQHRVQLAPDPVRAGVGLEVVIGLQAQPVLDGEEVQQSALGLLSQLAQ